MIQLKLNFLQVATESREDFVIDSNQNTTLN